MRSTSFAWLMILLVAVSGCIQTVPNETGTTDTGDGGGGGGGDGDDGGDGGDDTNDTTESLLRLTLNRHLGVELNDDNKADVEAGDWRSLFETVFVVGVHGEEVAAADLTITYTNRQGGEVTRPITDLTNKATLMPGDTVTVEDANLTSAAVLTLKGETVASRAGPDRTWWTLGGQPLGVYMAPGSGLSYDLASGASENITYSGDVPGVEEARIDLLQFLLGVSHHASVDLDYAADTTAVTAGESHTARPLSWAVEGDAALEFIVSMLGTNLTSGETIDAGFALDENTAVAYDAFGTLWVNTEGGLVRADMGGGNASWGTGYYAWLDADAETEANFSCGGMTRADRCEPTEIPEMGLTGSSSAPASSVNLDVLPDAPPTLDAALNSFFGEDLRDGDRFRVRMDLSGDAFSSPHSSSHYGAEPEPACEDCQLKMDIDLRVHAPESVTTGAGTFEALKLTEVAEFKVMTAEEKDADGNTLIRAITLEDRVVESTIWLANGTFVPLRVDRTMPLDVDEMFDDVLGAIEPAGWEAMGMDPLANDSLDLTVDATWSLELTRHQGEVHMAPWLAVSFLSSSMSGSVSGGFIGAFMGGFVSGLGDGFMGGPSDDGYAWPPHELDVVQVDPLTTDPAAAAELCGVADAQWCVTFVVDATSGGLLASNLTVWDADDYYVFVDCLVNGLTPAEDVELMAGDDLACYGTDDSLPEVGHTFEFDYDWYTLTRVIIA